MAAAARREAEPKVALPALLIPLSLYNGYFGAGAGVMVLTLMLLLVDRHLPTANALKNMLIGAAQICAATVFVLAADVNWAAALPLGAGMLVGQQPRAEGHPARAGQRLAPRHRRAGHRPRHPALDRPELLSDRGCAPTAVRLRRRAR